MLAWQWGQVMKKDSGSSNQGPNPPTAYAPQTKKRNNLNLKFLHYLVKLSMPLAGPLEGQRTSPIKPRMPSIRASYKIFAPLPLEPPPRQKDK